VCLSRQERFEMDADTLANFVHSIQATLIKIILFAQTWIQV
jgi:hypothetical protein